jgi:hypothetical protein
MFDVSELRRINNQPMLLPTDQKWCDFPGVMSASGTKQTSLVALHMTALGGKADMAFWVACSVPAISANLAHGIVITLVHTTPNSLRLSYRIRIP